MTYWACARLELRREAVAQHFLKLNGYGAYIPRVREQRFRRGKRIEIISPLFPAYAFIVIEQQWHRARWSIGVAALIMDGEHPARVPDQVIAGIRAREVRGAVAEVIRAQTWGSRENPRWTISRAPGALRGNETASAGRGIARAFGQPAAGDLAAC